MQVQPGSSDQKAKAKGLLQKLKRRDIVIFAHFVFDVILILKKLSLVAQGKASLVSDVQSSLNLTLAMLSKYEKRSTPKENEIKDVSTFGEQDLCGTRVLSNLKDCLENRFTESNSDVIKAASIASFSLWPQESEREEFGDQDVGLLTVHFRRVLEDANVATDEIAAEWSMLKHELYSRQSVVQKQTWSGVQENTGTYSF